MADRKDGNIKTLLEAALFISSRPLMLDDIGKITGTKSMGVVKQLVEDLQKEYAGRGIEIASTPQGWQMQVNTGVLHTVAHLTTYSDIPEGCKRTLALIVYKEPLKQSELVKIQGNKSYAYIKFLEKRGMIKSEKFSRTKLLKVTKEFEAYFGEPKERIKERIAEGINAIEKEGPVSSAGTTYDGKMEKLKSIEGLNEFFSRLDRPVAAPKESAASVEDNIIEEARPKKFRLPKDLGELSTDDFKIVKKEK